MTRVQVEPWHHDLHGLVRNSVGLPVFLVYGYETKRQADAEQLMPLLLAAPNLLAVLREANNELAWIGGGPRPKDREAFRHRMTELQDVMRAAIGKAEGRSE